MEPHGFTAVAPIRTWAEPAEAKLSFAPTSAQATERTRIVFLHGLSLLRPSSFRLRRGFGGRARATRRRAGYEVSLPLTTGTLTAGAQTLLVGCTLAVGTAAAQTPDTYTSAAFTVTVNYN